MSLDLGRYEVFLGHWWTEMTHPMIDGVMRGTAEFSWLEGRAYLLQRARTDHPDAPDSLSVLGPDEAGEALTFEYFDSRGVKRTYVPSFDGTTYRLERLLPGFSQRLEATLSADGRKLDGQWQLDQGDGWADDLTITFRR